MRQVAPANQSPADDDDGDDDDGDGGNAGVETVRVLHFTVKLAVIVRDEIHRPVLAYVSQSLQHTVVWNSLPDDLRAQQDYESFRQRLETWLFSSY